MTMLATEKDSSVVCPSCDSPAPHLHPAMQWEGEVQPCPDEYHATVTPSNTGKRIAEWRAFFAEVGA